MTLLLITTRDLWVGVSCLVVMLLLFYYSWRQVVAAARDEGVLLLYDDGHLEVCVEGGSWPCQLHKQSQLFTGVLLLKLTGFDRSWLVIYSSSMSAVDNARLRRQVIKICTD